MTKERVEGQHLLSGTTGDYKMVLSDHRSHDGSKGYGLYIDHDGEGISQHDGNNNCLDRVSKSKLFRRMMDEDNKDDTDESQINRRRRRPNEGAAVGGLIFLFIGAAVMCRNRGETFLSFFNGLPRSLSLNPPSLAWHAPPLKRPQPTMALGIFTYAASVEYRETLRETFLSQKGICTLNSYIQQEEDISQHYGGGGKQNCTLVYTFVLPQNHDHSHTNVLKKETSHDMLFLDYELGHSALEKSKKWFSYMSSKYLESGYIDYVGKVNQDTLIHTPQLIKFIQHDLDPAPYNRRMYGGVRQDYNSCWKHVSNMANLESGSNNDLSVSTICDSTKGFYYMSQQFYWVSIDLADYVSSEEAHQSMPHLWGFEDIDLWRILASLAMPVKGVGIPSHWILKKRKGSKEGIVVDPKTIQQYWNKIQMLG